jgi:nitrile hydratase accessory protein
VSRAADLDREGRAAPPRRNGELVFEAPWEARVFGLTLALCDAGAIDYETFRRRLIDEVGAWDRDAPPGAAYCYYARWLAALERVLDEAGLCARDLLDHRERELAARPAGHDHGRHD